MGASNDRRAGTQSHLAGICQADLISAGWHWHPVDHVKVFDLADALKHPSHLDSRGLDVDTWGDNSSACFVGNERLAVALSDDVYDDDEEDEDEPGDPDNEQHHLAHRGSAAHGL